MTVNKDYLGKKIFEVKMHHQLVLIIKALKGG